MIDRQTDILIIGGSGAGISAAIAAVEKGSRVTLVSKGRIGKAGNVQMAGGSFSIDGKNAKELGYRTANDKVTPDVVFDNLVKEGYYLNDQNLVRQFVEESPRVAYELVQFGEKVGQKFAFLPPGKWFSVGRAWAAGLKAAAAAHPQIDILEDCLITHLLRSEKRVIGAVGYHIYTGEEIRIIARAIVIASGGYQVFSLQNTVTDMTGDGPAMAYRAGAKLADMEFVLCFPTALSPLRLRGSIYPYLIQVLMGKWGMPPVVRDKNGREILTPPEVYELVRGSKMEKLTACYYWGREIFEGNGTEAGGIWFDYSSYPQKKREEIVQRYIDYMSTWHRRGYYMGDDIQEVYRRILTGGYLEVGLGCEYSNGGIVVNEKMETGVEGLYAAGESTSGVFGAMRAGDGLIEMLVQGNRAGISAADYASDSKDIQETEIRYSREWEVQGKAGGADDPSYCAGTPDEIMEQCAGHDGISTVEARRKLEEIADRGFNFVRSGERIAKSRKELEQFAGQILPNMTIKEKSRNYNLELLDYHAVHNLYLCLKLGLEAADMRKESRGSHIRVDFPQVDHEHFLHRTVFGSTCDGHSVETVTPPAFKFALPKGCDADIISYLFNEEHNYLRPKMR